jgi:hypothetical protein
VRQIFKFGLLVKKGNKKNLKNSARASSENNCLICTIRAIYRDVLCKLKTHRSFGTFAFLSPHKATAKNTKEPNLPTLKKNEVKKWVKRR